MFLLDHPRCMSLPFELNCLNLFLYINEITGNLSTDLILRCHALQMLNTWLYAILSLLSFSVWHPSYKWGWRHYLLWLSVHLCMHRSMPGQKHYLTSLPLTSSFLRLSLYCLDELIVLCALCSCFRQPVGWMLLSPAWRVVWWLWQWWRHLMLCLHDCTTRARTQLAEACCIVVLLTVSCELLPLKVSGVFTRALGHHFSDLVPTQCSVSWFGTNFKSHITDSHRLPKPNYDPCLCICSQTW